jgi:tRNA (adenine57-N1/adenine58-N1)-methyltransferase
MVIDLPEPWRMVPAAERALVAGGVLLAYLPTVPQVVQAVEALSGAGTFGLIETAEVLLRPWNIEGRSVRPAHRMVAHTGFLVTARRVEHGAARAAGMGPRPAALTPGEADDADNDQIDRDDEVEQARDNEDQDARDQGDER